MSDGNNSNARSPVFSSENDVMKTILSVFDTNPQKETEVTNEKVIESVVESVVPEKTPTIDSPREKFTFTYRTKSPEFEKTIKKTEKDGDLKSIIDDFNAEMSRDSRVNMNRIPMGDPIFGLLSSPPRSGLFAPRKTNIFDLFKPFPGRTPRQPINKPANKFVDDFVDILMDVLLPGVPKSKVEKTKVAPTKTVLDGFMPSQRKVVVTPKNEMSPSDIVFFEDYYKDYTGDVSTLTPEHRAIYDRVHVEPAEYIPPIVGYTTTGAPIFLKEDGTEVCDDPSISGSHFNGMYQGVKLIKLTNATGDHNGFQFKEGFNVDTQTFDANVHCGNGLYFCTEAQANRWFSYGRHDMEFVWDVVIPDDAKVMIYPEKIKADKFYLFNKRRIGEFAISRVRDMLFSGEDSSNVVGYLRHLDSSKYQSNELQRVLADIVQMNPEAFSQLYDEEKSEELCRSVAGKYFGSYLDMPESMKYDEGIAVACVSSNPGIFGDIEEDVRTPNVSAIAVNFDSDNYEYVPDHNKNVQMTLEYLANNPAGSSNVPRHLKNDEDVIDLILEVNPYDIAEIDYKNITHERCLAAVEEDGAVLPLIPFSFMNEEICVAAVRNCSDAYAAVPDHLKTVVVRETLVEYHPECILDIRPEDVTLKMLKNVATECSGMFGELDYESKALADLIASNITELIVLNPDIVVSIPKGQITEEDVLRAISLNSSVYWYINQEYTSLEFAIRAVKAGVAFSVIPENKVTLDVLESLVEYDDEILDRLPERYLSPELYSLAIMIHGYDYTKVPEQFMTPDLESVIADVDPESEQAFDAFVAEMEGNVEIVETEASDEDIQEQLRAAFDKRNLEKQNQSLVSSLTSFFSSSQ